MTLAVELAVAPLDRETALELLQEMAAAVRVRYQGAETTARDRLLERVSSHTDAEMLRDALAEAGALALVRAAPGGWRPPRQ